ncbi:DUF4352 domain-containing protein [Enterococcus entomosocium]|uniref:DUF4352 domain-containing protein n=1 Tax=Enterococcus entomosocium TaxID=3034352 RepID=UPI003BD81F0C
MKKLAKALALTTILLLNGCSTKESEQDTRGEAVSNDFVSVEVIGGEYILDEENMATEEEGYLALNIRLENKSKESLDVYENDFSLYDSDGNQVASKRVYAEENAGLKEFSASSLSGKKSTNGYIVFNIDKGQEYELHYQPAYYTDQTKAKEIEVKIDTSKFSDDATAVQQLTQRYIEEVFLGKTTDTSDTSDSTGQSETQGGSRLSLTNDLSAEHDTFNETFTKLIKDDLFSYYEPSATEIEKILESYEKANQENGKVTYTIASLYPKQAIVYVKPELINFYDVDVNSIDDEFTDANRGKYTSADYDKIYTDAEKYRAQKLPEVLSNTENTSSESGDGYRIILVKTTDGKWSVDSSDSTENYDFSSLKEVFMGGLYE